MVGTSNVALGRGFVAFDKGQRNIPVAPSPQQAFEAHRLVRAMVGASAGCDARAPETVQHRCSNSPGRGGHPGHFVDARAHVDGRRIACTSGVFRDPKRTGSTGRTGDPLVTMEVLYQLS
jgi:hypothetical protein